MILNFHDFFDQLDFTGLVGLFFYFFVKSNLTSKNWIIIFVKIQVSKLVVGFGEQIQNMISMNVIVRDSKSRLLYVLLALSVRKVI